MVDPGFVDVCWIGGPYDGADMALPSLYREGQFVDMPDPATAANTDASAEPAIFTGPQHRYKLEWDGARLIARHWTF